MSQLSDYAENCLVDLFRGQAWTLGASLYCGLASAAADGSITELTGTGYGRVGVSRALASWAGTQAPGSVAASTGTSHASSNNAAINWGTAGSAWGTMAYVTVHDASTSGNLVAYFPVAPLVIGSGDPVSIAAGSLSFTLGLAGGCSDWLANQLIDFIFRGQAFTAPTPMYAALMTAAPSNAGGGTEVGGGVGYARVSYAGSLANWAGTQAAGTTAVSTGTGGLTSNNAAITFPAATGSWGTVGWVAWYDAASAGNLLFWAPLGASKSVPAGGSPLTFPAAAFDLTFS